DNERQVRLYELAFTVSPLQLRIRSVPSRSRRSAQVYGSHKKFPKAQRIRPALKPRSGEIHIWPASASPPAGKRSRPNPASRTLVQSIKRWQCFTASERSMSSHSNLELIHRLTFSNRAPSPFKHASRIPTVLTLARQ